MRYWDTSALAKLYVAESDSAQFSVHWQQTGVITTSALARWEIFCVLARKEADGLIPSGAAEIIFSAFLADVATGAVLLVPMGGLEEYHFRRTVLRLYRSKPPLFTRTLDGVHIATALSHAASQFVSTDLNMRKCAAAVGLAVYP
jgi:predicted nucleic acid-binding protein